MVAATNTTVGEIVLSGDLAGSGDGNTPQLRASGVTPGTYAPIQRMSVDSKGRIVSVGKMALSDIAALLIDATSSSKGVIRVTSGAGLSISGGVVTLTLPNATTSSKGHVQIGSGLAVTVGVISTTAQPDATTSTKGVVQIGTGLAVASGVVSLVTLTDATTSTKGVVQVGTGLAVTAGVISTTAQPDATTSSKGQVQIGSGLAVTSGVMSAISLPDATTSTKGQVQIGSGLAVTSGVVSRVIADATTSTKGQVQIGSGLAVASGVMSVSLPDATISTKGVVQVGTGLAVTVGVISTTAQPDATTSTKGVVQVGTGLAVASGVASVVTASTSTIGAIQIGSGLNVSAEILKIDNTIPVMWLTSGFNAYSNTTGNEFNIFLKAVATILTTATVTATLTGAALTIPASAEVIDARTSFDQLDFSDHISSGAGTTYMGGYYWALQQDVVGGNSRVVKSTDFFKWTSVGSPLSTPTSGNSIGSNATTLVVANSAAGAGGYIFSSTNGGLSWNATATPTGGYNGMCVGPVWNSFVFCIILGQKPITSPDGITWTAGTNISGFNATAGQGGAQGLAYGGGRFVAISGPSTAYSIDGLTWTAGGALTGYNTGSNPDPEYLVWDGTYFIATAFSKGTAYRSTNGVLWTSFSLPSFSTIVTLGMSVVGSTIGLVKLGATNSYYFYTSTNSGATWSAGVDLSPYMQDGLYYVVNSQNGIFVGTTGSAVISPGGPGSTIIGGLPATITTTRAVTTPFNRPLPVSIELPVVKSGKKVEIIVTTARDITPTFTGMPVQITSSVLSAGSSVKMTALAYSKTGTANADNWLITYSPL